MADLAVHRYDFAMPAALEAFDAKRYVDEARTWVDATVGPTERVALSASGGVDSTTVAFLLKEVLGDRLYPFFIDDGLRRLIEGREEWEVTAEIFKGFPNFVVIHTGKLVLPWFEGVEDGTDIVVGAGGSVIVHPFAPTVQELLPTALVALTR